MREYFIYFLGAVGLLWSCTDFKWEDPYPSGWGYNDRYNMDRMFKDLRLK